MLPRPLTSQHPACSGEGINIFMAATVAPHLYEMSLQGDDAGKELVGLEDDGRGKGGCWTRCNSASWAPLFSPSNSI